MARLIDADALKERAIRVSTVKEHTYFKAVGTREIDKAPTVDAVEVVHSFWDDSGRYVFPSGRKAICCDICKCALSVGEYNRFKWNYCPVCGAKMDGERRDNV